MNPIASDSDRKVANWLLACCALVFAMVVLGGVTRLTGSGLSMVEWQPLTGVLPPLTDEAWQETFEMYQATPEFQKKNSHMNVDDFKGIFWLEFLHRLLGRTIGIVGSCIDVRVGVRQRQMLHDLPQRTHYLREHRQQTVLCHDGNALRGIH